MNRFHLATKVAFAIDIIIVSGLVVLSVIKMAHLYGPDFLPYSVFSEIEGLFNYRAIPALGIVGLCLSIIGFIKRRTKLSFVFIIISVIFTLWNFILVIILVFGMFYIKGY